MPRPKGFEPSKKTRAQIAKFRRGKKLDADTKEKIGAGVRHSTQNKVALATRIDAEINREFRAKAKSRGLKLAPAIEEAMAKW